ncbi:MAG: SPOR domain-containing protein [Magnetococcales bacterium]|nr:SPOR domain-containing protein [Magnetococcales bacterium]
MSLIHQMLRDFEKIRHASGQAQDGVGVNGVMKFPAGLGGMPGRQRLLWLAGGMALASAVTMMPWLMTDHKGDPSGRTGQETSLTVPSAAREAVRQPTSEAASDQDASIPVLREENSLDDGSPQSLDSVALAMGQTLELEAGATESDHSTRSTASDAGSRDGGRGLAKGATAPFMVQMGVFPTLEEAKRFQEKLPASARESSRISPVRDLLNRPMFAVRSGPFVSREKAAAVSGGYASQGMEGAFVAQAVEDLPLLQVDGKVGKMSEEVLPPILSAGQPSSTPSNHAVKGEGKPASSLEENGKTFFLYAIQAGSFREQTSADALAAKLRERGMYPYVLRLRDVDNTLWHSVCFGLFTDMDVAKQALARTRNGDLGKAYVLPVESRSFIKFIARRGDGTTAAAHLEKEVPAGKVPADKAVQRKAKGKAVHSQADQTPTATEPVAKSDLSDVARPVEGVPATVATNDGITLKKSYIDEKDRYAIQVGSFIEDGSARDLVRDLRKRGYDPYILELPTSGKSGKMRKTVRIGNFQDLREAEKAGLDFRKREKRDGYVVTIDSSHSPGDLPEKVAGQVVASRSINLPLVKSENALAAVTGTESDSGKSGTSDPVTSGGAAAEKPVSAAPVARGANDKGHEVGTGTPGPVGGKVDVLEDYNGNGNKVSLAELGAEEILSGRQAMEHKPPQVPEAVAAVPLTGSPVVEAHTSSEGTTPFLHKPRPLKEVIQKAGQGVSGKTMQSDRFFQEAQRLEREGDNKGAEDFSRRALDLNSSNHRARELLARILFTSGRSNEAYPLLSDGLAKGFDSGLVKLFARILVQDGKTESALGVLENAQAQGGAEDEELMALLAAMYQRNKNHWKAIDLYEKLLAKHQDNAIWWMGLAISLEGVEEKSSALQAYHNAMENGQLKLNLKNFVSKRIQALSN